MNLPDSGNQEQLAKMPLFIKLHYQILKTPKFR